MDLNQLVATVRRRWLILTVVPLVGLLLGGLNALATPREYRSTTTVLFALNRGATVSEIAEGSTYTQDLVPSYATVVRMPTILEPVIEQLGLDTTSTRLAQHVKVDLDQNSVLLKIEVTDPQADRAARIANTIAATLATRVPALSPQSGDGSARITATRITPAVAAAGPTTPDVPIDLAVGLILGLVLAVAGTAAFELVVSSPVRTREAARRLSPAPMLGTIVNDPRAKQRPLPVSTHPYVARAEGIRLLLTTLQLQGDGEAPASLAVLGSSPGEGSTSTAVNLAIAMCHAGRRVLLVDADLRDGGVCELLGLKTTTGLSTVLTQRSRLESTIVPWLTQFWGDRQLSVLPAGPRPLNPSELLSSRMMRDLLGQVREQYDAVVLNGAPLLTVTDGAILATQTDGAVLVIDAEHTRQRQVTESLTQLEMAGAHLTGMVLNKVAEDRHQYGAAAPKRVRRATPLPEDPPQDTGPRQLEAGRPSRQSRNTDA